MRMYILAFLAAPAINTALERLLSHGKDENTTDR